MRTKFRSSFINTSYSIKLMLIALMTMVLTQSVFASRIKDIATIEGVSGVQVIGYGLISGLNNTGDTQRSSFAVQSVVNMLKRFGVTPQQVLNLRTRNVAAVMVTATIPMFLKKGSKIDVQVSAIGDAESIQGGVLLMTPLNSVDGKVFGFAQGGVSVGGYDFRSLGSRAGRNFTTSGRVPSGMILEKSTEGNFVSNSQLRILLREPDFTTSVRIAEAINKLPNLNNTAEALDAATVVVKLPAGITQQKTMELASQIELAQVTMDAPGRVVINERTGTIVIGGTVQLLPAVIAHGGIEIQIQRNVAVSQPAPFSFGTTQRLENANVNATEERNPSVPITKETTSVQEMADALNKLKVSPRDLIAIFQALKESGSLQGDLIIQ